MKIQCDVFEKAPATVICCADEAALCAGCNVQVHAANKLASKHRRLLLQHCLSNYNLPRCDICQKDQLEFGELDWLVIWGSSGNRSLIIRRLTAAEVPQLPVSQPNNFPTPNSRTNKLNAAAQKKQRIEVPEDEDEDEEYFTVPDLCLD